MSALTHSTPLTAPPSPFFEPHTPQVTVVQQTPGGTKRQVQQKQEVKEHKSGLLGCTANLINAIVGSGIVGIPYAVKQAGFVAGILLVILCAFLTDKSLRLLVATAKHVHCPSYETAFEAAYGVLGFQFVTINMLIMAYGAMLSYLMIVKDSFSSIFGVNPDNLPVRRAILLVVSLAVQLPLSSKRDMADLAFTSRISVIIDTILVFLVAYNAPIVESLESIGGAKSLFANNALHAETVFVGLGVLSFAFVCQHSAFIIAGSLEKPTIARWSAVSKSALTFCGALALLCGVSGYLGYMEDTTGNVLQNLDPDNWTTNAARGMLGVTMLFVYPMESFVARHVCVVLFFAGRRAHEGDDSTILNRRDRRIGLTALLYLFAVVPAAAFEELGPVLAITGAIGGSCLSYIGPGLLFLGVHGERFMTLIKETWLGSLFSEPQQQDSNRQPRQNRLPLKETTPLVSQVPKGEAADAKQAQAQSEFFLVTLTKHFCCWILGVPVWWSLARWGKKGLEKHAREMALKSPHPIRIGDVEYARSDLNNPDHRRTATDPISNLMVLSPGKQLIRHGSFGEPNSQPIVNYDSLGGTKPAPPKPGIPSPSLSTFISGGKPGVGINQLLGKELVEKKRIREKIVAIEKDPQEAPANWFDFLIAIFYIVFGVLALFAGILSLFKDSESSRKTEYVGRLML